MALRRGPLASAAACRGEGEGVSSRFILIASGIALAVSPVAVAQVAPARSDPSASPTAEIRIYSSDGRIARRSFDLINGTATSLCVASTTGRYRLRVTSLSGGTMRGADAGTVLGYRVKFRDATGAEQIKQMDGAEVVFEGRSPGQASCAHGANALLLVDSPDQTLAAPVAGTYADRLNLTVEPL
jgi:hypothetical protein